PTRFGIGRTTNGFAVDGHQPVLGDLLDGLYPTQQALLEGPGIEPGQDAREGIFRGDPIGQIEVAGQPVPAIDGELVNPRERVGAAQDSTDGHEDDVDQGMLASAGDAGILKILEVVVEGGRSGVGHELLLGEDDGNLVESHPSTVQKRSTPVYGGSPS